MATLNEAPRTNRGVTVEASRVSKIYNTAKGGGVHALDDVSLDLSAGEFVSIVGPSGCGKSTLMMMVAGLIPYSSGTLVVDGKPVKGPVADNGIVFQRDLLLDWRNVLDNVLLPIEIKRLNRSQYVEKARELLALVGLSGFENRYPSELSGGMRQRVAIVRALIQAPGLLLMDEPFGALDALTREQINMDLQRIWMNARNTVLFITHSIEEAVFLSDRVVVMSSRPGKVVDILNIDLSRPRGAHSRTDQVFMAAIAQIRHCFQTQGILSEV